MGICLHTNSISSKTAVAATIWSVNICWWHSFFSRHCVFPPRARSTLLFHTHLLQFSNELKIYIFIRNNTFINASDASHTTILCSFFLLSSFSCAVSCLFAPTLCTSRRVQFFPVFVLKEEKNVFNGRCTHKIKHMLLLLLLYALHVQRSENCTHLSLLLF